MNIMERHIVLPLALKVFRRDYKEFSEFKTATVYLNKLDAVIERVRQDMNEIKRQLIVEYRTQIKYLEKDDGIVKYEWRKESGSGIVEYTPEQLKDMTNEVMQYYLMSTEFEIKDRAWM